MKWYVGVGILLLVAIILQMGLLIYALGVLLAIMLISRFLARTWMENLSAKRKCNLAAPHSEERLGGVAQIGDTLNVQVTINNKGRLPVPWVLLEDVLPPKALKQRPPRLKVTGKRLRLAMIGSQGKTTLKYEVELQMRGYYQIGPLTIEGGDLFGLHRRFRVGTEPHFVLVYPRVIPMSGYDLASRRPIGEIRLTHRLYEDPTRIGGVRLYQAGDPLNRVHWRATARTQTLHSKIYEPSTIAGGTILLDFHKDAYHVRGEPYRSELAVTAAASIANALYTMNQQVGLITNGRDTAERIRREGWDGDFRTRQAAKQKAAEEDESDRLQPQVVQTRRGPEQIQRILETLARVELTDGLHFPELVIETAHRMPRDATVIALLGEVTPETAFALGNVRRQGLAVTAILLIFEDKPFEAAYARLVSEGVEVRHIKDETGLADMCRPGGAKVRSSHMPLTADEMIAALDRFEADSEYDENQLRLYPITDGFRELPNRERVVPAMFALMERFPDAYLGTPGPLVHSIESLDVERYEPLLVSSVRRQPAELNVSMINRILNTKLPPEKRMLLLNLMRDVPHHPKVPARVAELARGFLRHQAKQEAS